MVQIEKRKKKGRPSKSDLQSRRATAPDLTADEQDRRRSLRRRTFRYNIIDYDEDYLDDDQDDSVFDEEDDDEDEDARRDKKVKLVVKISCDDSVTRPGRLGRVGARDGELTPSCDEFGEVRAKKRRIGGRVEKVVDDLEDDGDDDVEDEDDDVEDDENENEKGRDRKEGRKKDDYNVPGTRRKENDGPTPLPDKKHLELILDKLQKKDTYGVYSEPVDPDELPDYHEVIEHPMDFSTVRKKLADGCYSTFEEFECDVFLISSNAMQYNASDTVYHKQARAIKELAEKKFQRIRFRMEQSELNPEPSPEPKSEPQSEAKYEPKEKPIIKKQIKKPLWHGVQEPVVSDFPSGATLVTEDPHNSCGADVASKHERPSNNDGPVEGVASLADHTIEKADDPLSGKGPLPKFAKRSSVVDENRRATYNKSNLPEERPESLFTTFESDKKQLIPVGLSGEYAYCRSLSRFAANLGPIAWRIASKRIEQFLPTGLKYGRGWIGEFEPLPSAVVYVGQQKDPFVSSCLLSQPTFHGKVPKKSSFGGSVSPITNVSASQHHIPLQHTPGVPPNSMPKKVEPNCLPSNDQKASPIFQQHIRVPRNVPSRDTTGSHAIPDHEKDGVPHRQLHRDVEVGGRSVELCSPLETSKKLNNFSQKQSPGLDMSVPMGRSLSLPFGQPESNGHVLNASGNGKLVNNFVDSNQARSLPGSVSTQQFPQRLDQSLNDPVLVMKMLTEKAQRQQNGSVHPHNTSQPRPSLSSPRGDPGGNAAALDANAWMSVGALGFRPPTQNPSMSRSQMSSDSLHNGTRVFYPQAMQSRVDCPVSGTMQFPSEKIGSTFPTFTTHPVKASNEVPMGFPQFATHDLTRFQMQTPWCGLSPHTEQKQKPKQKQDMLPPDLNVAFQSSVDSQQPDLALQL